MDTWTRLLTLLLVVKAVNTLRILKLVVPQTVQSGEAVELTCAYDLEGDNLYSIKWYRDDMEFFRFVPRDNPPWQFFPLKGIKVDFTRSSQQSVYIQNVQTNTGGKFRCEVSADAPLFRTAAAEKVMSVEEFTGTASGLLHPSDGAGVLLLVLGCMLNVYLTYKLG
ncbi:uncharacterized protein LOC111088176 [Limulus polyphemus]|uniref:Uncharacterized protein LOC111088176 n=1 Tax=Limulus polyphemus TaxID=6850 RepID=A0ABM1TB59_LIMPO|nr:uncharacterized protein LOC111088176 [Limulus polyphemus]